MLTSAEKIYCKNIASRVEQMRVALNEHSLGDPEDIIGWYKFLSRLKDIQGNLNNDISFVATLLTKQYLVSRFTIDYDAAAKPQGAPGIDVDVTTHEGFRVVAEIKTTMPYQVKDFGAQQMESFKKDFAKLSSADARHKFLFVTEKASFSVLKKPKYTKLIPGVKVVLLPCGDEFTA